MNNQESTILPNIGGAPLPTGIENKKNDVPKSQDEIFEMMEAISENPDLGVHKVEGVSEDAPPLTREELEAMIAMKRPMSQPQQSYVEVDYNQLIGNKPKEKTETIEAYQPGPTDMLTTTIELPSAGYFGGPTKVQIRPMTIREEEILFLADDNPTYLDDIALSCIVSPKTISLDNLHPNDLVCILFAIRNISFGNEYRQNTVCPACRENSQALIDITTLPINYLDASYVDIMKEVQLHDKPNCITLDILTEGDLIRLDESIREGIRKNKIKDPKQAKLFEFRARREAAISLIDGKPFKDKAAKTAFMDSLTGRDYNLITGASIKIRGSFGLDRDIELKCSNCKRSYESEAAIVPEFFRPSFED